MLKRQNEQAQCRFCFGERDTSKNPFLAPCECKGSSQYVHLFCLNTWRNKNSERNFTYCTVCNTPYTIPYQYSLEEFPKKHIFHIVLDYPIWINFTLHYIWVIWAGIVQKTPETITTYATFQLAYKAYYILSIARNFRVRKWERYTAAWKKEVRYLFFPFYGGLVGHAIFSDNPFYWFVPSLYMIMFWHIHLTILNEMNEEDMKIPDQDE